VEKSGPADRGRGSHLLRKTEKKVIVVFHEGAEMRRVTILGMGQMGCSLAALIKERHVAEEVVGSDRDVAHLEMAGKCQLIEQGLEDPVRAVIGAQAVILCVPVDEVFVLLNAVGPALRPGAVLACTAGTSARIRKEIHRAIPSARNFVPSFPLVFSNRRGPGGSSHRLLNGCTTLVSTNESVPQDAVERTGEFWRSLGMSVQTVDAEYFEWCVVGVHHWPILVASLARRVAERGRWPEGGTAAGQWLELFEHCVGSERNDQLHASRLLALLDELTLEIESEQKKLGKIFQGGAAPSRCKERLVVTIDGPAGSGKSTVAQKIAKRLGYVQVDTGAIYRCLALLALQSSVAEDDEKKLSQLAGKLGIHFEKTEAGEKVFLGNDEVTERIRNPEISQLASKISVFPMVREALLSLQREMGKDGGVVLEGRDTGTVVFPEAQIKIFLLADPKVRAKRRHQELCAKGKEVSFEETLEEVLERDRRDENRELAPLKPAADAVRIDTGPLTIEEVVAKILDLVQLKLNPKETDE
jgi:CMP/dCMP kinase